MRTGVLGGEDIYHPVYSIECKSREKLPKWFMKMWEQCLKNCTDNKTPLLIIHELNKRHDDDWVVIRMKDFLEVVKKEKDG